MTAPNERTFLFHARQKLISGLFVVLPFVIAVTITTWLFSFVDYFISPIVRFFASLLFISEVPGYVLTVFGLVGTVIALYFIGEAAQNFFGKKFIQLGELLFDQIPVFRNVYNAVKQLLESLSLMDHKTFKETVLVEYPRKGAWAVGFVTSHFKDELKNATGEEITAVFVPTTPNPTSGWIVLIPSSEVRYLGVGVEEGMRFILSAGFLKFREGLPAQSPEEAAEEVRTELFHNR